MNERPIGVTILAVLHLLVGLILAALQVSMIVHYDRFAPALDKAGNTPLQAIIGLMPIAVVLLVSGLAMLAGVRWGWWCATFYYLYGVARNANALVMVAVLAEGIEDPARGATYYYVKFGGRVLVHALLFLYFFKPNVWEYFGMEGQSKGKAVVRLIAATAAVFGAVTCIAWFVG
jgi:hypothetical protein